MTKTVALSVAVIVLGTFHQPTIAQEAPAAPPGTLDLYLLVGQSNMAGRGEVEAQDRQPYPRVLMLDRNNQWVAAVDPMHFDKRIAGVGPGRTFGIKMAEQHPSATIGLIPCAVGGTSIRKWEPGAYDEKTDCHPYDDMLKRLHLAQKSGSVRAILWLQGESDAAMGMDGTYAKALRQLIERLRAECRDPEVPFVIGQMPRFAGKPWSEGRTKVDQAHRELADQIPHCAFVFSEGLTDRGDLSHFDAPSARLLGERFARKVVDFER